MSPVTGESPSLRSAAQETGEGQGVDGAVAHRLSKSTAWPMYEDVGLAVTGVRDLFRGAQKCIFYIY